MSFKKSQCSPKTTLTKSFSVALDITRLPNFYVPFIPMPKSLPTCLKNPRDSPSHLSIMAKSRFSSYRQPLDKTYNRSNKTAYSDSNEYWIKN